MFIDASHGHTRRSKKPAVERRETQYHFKSRVMVHIFRWTIVEDIHSVAHMKEPDRVQILAHLHTAGQNSEWSRCECWIIGFGKLNVVIVWQSRLLHGLCLLMLMSLNSLGNGYFHKTAADGWLDVAIQISWWGISRCPSDLFTVLY